MFAKKKLPQAIAKYVKQTRAKRFMDDLNKEGKTTKAVWNPKLWPLSNVQEFEACCRKAFIETNQAMHDEKFVSRTAMNQRIDLFKVLTFLVQP